MTRNTFDDNTTLWAGQLNALANAHEREGIVSGVEPSKGTGDWDVDTTSGTVRIRGTVTDVTAQSPAVTLTAPASDSDLDAGESRIDIVHVNGSGTFSSTEGTAATNPTTPNIPSDEALIAVIHIEESDSTLADSDIFAYPGALASPLAAGESDTLSDITQHTIEDDGTSGSDLLSLSTDGIFLGGWAIENNDDGSLGADYTIDGATTQSISAIGITIGGNRNEFLILPPQEFDTSLTISITTNGTHQYSAMGYSKT